MAKTRLKTARIVKIWLDVGLVVGIAGCIGTALWLAVSPFVMTGGDRYADVTIPVAIGEKSVFPVLHLEVAGDAKAEAGEPEFRRPRIVKGRGELRVETTNWALQFLTNFGFLLSLLVMLYVIYLLRSVLKTIIQGDFFARVNVRRLRRIGYLFIALGIVVPAAEYLVAEFLLRRIPLDGFQLSAPIGFDPDPIVGGLLVLILSTIFSHGSRLEDDQSLTI